jgi:hypothetical protein
VTGLLLDPPQPNVRRSAPTVIVRPSKVIVRFNISIALLCQSFLVFFEVIPDAPLPLRPEQPFFAVAAVSLFFPLTRLSSFASLLSF